jgi:hypothetical protein
MACPAAQVASFAPLQKDYPFSTPTKRMHVNPLDEIQNFETSCPQPTISAYPNFPKPRESQHTLFLQRDGKQREGLDIQTDRQTLHIETVQVQMGNHSCFCRFWPSHWHLLVFLLPLSFSVAKKEKKNNTTNSGAGGWQPKKKDSGNNHTSKESTGNKF